MKQKAKTSSDSHYHLERDVSIVEEADWLPEHIQRIGKQDMTPDMALLYGNSLMAKAGGKMPENDEELGQIEQLIDLAQWFQHWGYEDIALTFEA